MPSKYEEEDLSRIRPIPIRNRRSKVSIDQFVDPEEIFPSGTICDLCHPGKLFPDLLAGTALKEVALAIKKAREKKREIVWLLGAHVIKCGLSLYINSLISRGFVTAIATTGSAAIHDLEISFFGKTSEDVEAELPRGRFGMSGETAESFSEACGLASSEGLGLGEGIGSYIARFPSSYKRYSLFAKAFDSSIPATVHVAFGTDITHQHPVFPAAAVGELTMRDFRILTRVVGRLFDGGVIMVFGSAVVLPEVFLKSVSVNYNLGRRASGVTAASFDMLPQYRVSENVLNRPFRGAGRSFRFLGHHEIMLPLLYLLLMGDSGGG